MAVGDAGRVGLAQTPFADDARGVAGLLEQLGHGHVLRPQRHPGVAADQRVTGVQPRHQAASRGRTDRAAGIAVRKPHTLLGHAIEVRRPDHLLAVAAEVAIAEIVGQDEDDVRRIGRRGGGA
ncbi:MAG: hypothetical protein A2V70_20800 [Planctomycetes bacterium RBG_13_63_9]|nr:MAG: hypothetical protein A2V70_20800 [Planctomycetes bacterium RBG_13_63_9]